MSRSKRLPYIKDNGGRGAHKVYRRKIRRKIRQSVRDISNLSDIETYEIPNPRTIVNGYNWCDYWFDYGKPWKNIHYYSLEDFYKDQKRIMRK